MLAKSTSRGGGNYTTFVHSGRQNQLKIKVLRSWFVQYQYVW